MIVEKMHIVSCDIFLCPYILHADGALCPDLHGPIHCGKTSDCTIDNAAKLESDRKLLAKVGRNIDADLARDFGTDGRGDYHPDFATTANSCARGSRPPLPPPVTHLRVSEERERVVALATSASWPNLNGIAGQDIVLLSSLSPAQLLSDQDNALLSHLASC